MYDEEQAEVLTKSRYRRYRGSSIAEQSGKLDKSVPAIVKAGAISKL